MKAWSFRIIPSLTPVSPSFTSFSLFSSLTWVSSHICWAVTVTASLPHDVVLKRHLGRIQPGSRRLRNHLGVNGAKTLVSSRKRPCTSSAHEHDVSTSVTDSDALECGSVIRHTRGEEQEEVKIQRLQMAAHEQRAKYNACASIAFVLQEYCAATMAIQLLFPKGSPLPTARDIYNQTPWRNPFLTCTYLLLRARGSV